LDNVDYTMTILIQWVTLGYRPLKNLANKLSEGMEYVSLISALNEATVT